MLECSDYSGSDYIRFSFVGAREKGFTLLRQIKPNPKNLNLSQVEGLPGRTDRRAVGESDDVNDRSSLNLSNDIPADSPPHFQFGCV